MPAVIPGMGCFAVENLRREALIMPRAPLSNALGRKTAHFSGVI